MNIVMLAAITDIARETGETFGFDLRMFLSQVISFVIVALVLRKFAYKPILTVLEERRQQIAEGLLNAEKIKQQLAEAEQRHAEILAKANASRGENDRRGARKRVAYRRAQTTGSRCGRGTNHGQGARSECDRA